MNEEFEKARVLLIGDWEVRQFEGVIRGPEGEQRLRPKSMDVLVCLASRPGDIFERDEIIAAVWGRELISDEPLTACIAELRRVLGDRRDRPSYIQTVPKRGYRLVASVSTPAAATGTDSGDAKAPAEPAAAPRRSHARVLAAVIVAVLLGAIAYFWPQQVDDQRPFVATEGIAIAVLPFENLSPDPEDTFLGDGLAEEILSSLTDLEGLRVTSRTSSFALAKQGLDVPELATRLDVSHILEGSVRRSGERLRITAQLIEVANDTRLWSEVFEAGAGDIFRIEREIAIRVADELQLRFRLPDASQPASVGTSNAEAYDWYLRGRDLLARRTTESLGKAIESFRLAHDLDTRFARAYVGLADAYLLMRDYNDRPSEGYLRKALRAADAALRLNPELGEAWTTLGAIRHEELDFAGAEEAFQRALELAPQHPKTLHWYGYYLYDTARQDEADRLLRAALERDPLSPILNYAVATNLIVMREFDAAEAGFRSIMKSDAEFAWAYEGMAELNWRGRNRLPEAIEWYRRAIAYDPSSADRRALLGQIYLDNGEFKEAGDQIKAALALRDDSVIVLAHQALQQMHRGELDAAGQTALTALELDPTQYLALYVARNYLLAKQRPTDARRLYATGHPKLFEPEPVLDRGNFQAAVDLALVLEQTGERLQAERLLERAEPIALAFPRAGLPYFLSDVKLLALRGDQDAALERLKFSADQGWRAYWSVFLEPDPALAGLRDNPGFAATVARLRPATVDPDTVATDH
ncbi:MAG: winged helix-turn-helix domain-containing protein [Chromatiales bacterium]|nr:MAG: winged helix-turn-helix domain-containing protein [Chromatiales bacterium]